MRDVFQKLLNGMNGANFRQILPVNELPYSFGTSSHDNFTASSGRANYFGGTGTDTVNYENSTSRVAVDLMQGRGGPGGNHTYNSIENVVGSNYDDILTGNNASNKLEGRGGSDRFVGSKGNDQLFGGDDVDTVDYSRNNKAIDANLTGHKVNKGAGNGIDRIDGIENVIGSNYGDELTGDDKDNVLNGRGGSDTFFSSKGDDTLIGGVGDDDTVDYSDNDQAISANLARNNVTKGNGNGSDTISGIENVVGSDFDDILTGDEKDNELDGRGRNDTFYGSKGNDTLIGGDDFDTVDYGYLEQGVNVDLATGSVDKGDGTFDTVTGIEEVVGTSFNDVMQGSQADEVFWGRDGVDTFKFENSAPNQNHGNDVIMDFTVDVDKIDLSGTEVDGFEDLLNYDPSDPQSEWGDRYMVQEGDNVVIYTNDGSEGDSITLKDVNIDNLSDNDFIF